MVLAPYWSSPFGELAGLVPGLVEDLKLEKSRRPRLSPRLVSRPPR